jgi:hypothetical protein
MACKHFQHFPLARAERLGFLTALSRLSLFL